MEIEACRRFGDHGHTPDELADLYRQGEWFGWHRQEEFIRLHTVAAAREEFVKNWGEEPERLYEDFMSQIEELEYRWEQDEEEARWAEESRKLDEQFTMEETAIADRRGITLEQFRELRWGGSEQGRMDGIVLIAQKRAGTLPAWLDNTFKERVGDDWFDLDR